MIQFPLGAPELPDVAICHSLRCHHPDAEDKEVWPGK